MSKTSLSILLITITMLLLMIFHWEIFSIKVEIFMFISLFILAGIIIFIQHSEKNLALLNEHCFRVLSEQAGRIIFEWDVSRDKIVALCNFEETFGRKMVTINSYNEAIDAGLIHEDDIEAYKNIFNSIQSGINIKDIKFRVKDSDERFRWCSLSGTMVNNHKGKPYKAIASLIDIDDQQKHLETLSHKACSDELTGLYNKVEVERLVTEILETSSQHKLHALISVDLDNFKNINDSFGHMFGDQVLKDVAEEIKALFRSTDILGRFGGDEFILFIRDIINIEFIQSKAAQLALRLDKDYSMENISHSLSVSIGISIYPQDGKNYTKLYQNADNALYFSKRNGKNRYSLYEQQTFD